MESVLLRQDSIELSPDLKAILEELLQLPVSVLNMLTICRTPEVFSRCIDYNNMSWEKFLLEAFKRSLDPISKEQCLHLAAANICQVLNKIKVYEVDLPRLINNNNHLRILRTCKAGKLDLSTIRADSVRRRALTTCIRALFGEFLNIGRKDTQTLGDRLRQLLNCSGSEVHFEVLDDIVISSKRQALDALVENQDILEILIVYEESEVFRKEWVILYCFALFLSEELATRTSTSIPTISPCPI